MPISLKAIRPKTGKLIDVDRTPYNVQRGLINYLETLKKEMQVYPEAQPYRARHKPYQRTYRLRRGWSVVIEGPGQGRLANGVSYKGRSYAVFPQGPRGGGRGKGERQTQTLRNLGWQSISDVARRTRPRFKEIMNRSIKGSTE